MLPCSVILALIGQLAVQAQVLTPSQVTISYHKPITATATCGDINGQSIKEMYCSLAGSSQYTPFNQYSYAEDRKENQQTMQELRNSRELFIQGGHGCGHCQADTENAHPAINMVDGNNSWWMSPPLSRGMQYNQVNITIDLLQEFHVAYVWLQMANSPKPGTWVLERSIDYGKTYNPWFYFADNDAECMRRFGVESLAPIERDDQVICRSDFSTIQPLENGEIVLNLLENRPSRDDFMSSASLQNFTRATNVRLRLLGTRTMQGHLMDLNDKTNPSVTRRYFYAIKEILMGGRCVCNGHASTCDIIDPRRPQTLVCRCEHNTCGDMCETCCPGFVAKKWEKTTANNNFTCEPCQCYGRTNECVYDEKLELEQQSIDIHGEKAGGGRCLNCRFNTEGINCNQCAKGYYRPEGNSWDQLEPCELCRCDPSKHNGMCAEGTGKCECQSRFTGENCDQCAPGYHSPPECFPCDCKVPGTAEGVCMPANGTCPCNEGYGGQFCETCSEGHTNVTAGCIGCECNSIGSVHDTCDVESGECVCKAAYGGRKCEVCAPGYYGFPDCKYCDCDPSGTENGVCDAESGQCLCKLGFAGRHCEQCDMNYFGYPNCKSCACDGAGSLSAECDSKTGECQCSGNFTGRTCDKCAAGFFGYPECKECSCLIDGAKGLTCDQNGQCFCKDNFQGSRCQQCKPNFYNFPLCEACNCDPNGVTQNFAGCDKVAPGELCECRKNVQGRVCNECKPTFWDLHYQHREGCKDCGCHLAGTLSRLNTCKQRGGQCSCKRNVASRGCDKCAHGYFNLQSFHPHGCEPCGCDVGGALKGDCDGDTGQCKCRPRVTGQRCDQPLDDHYFPSLWHIQYEAEDGHSPDNRPVRFAIDHELFPDFSWRGFAVFSPIQDKILLDLEIAKASVYRILLKVHNPSNITMTAKVTLTPLYSHDVDQSSKVSFPPSTSPFVSDVSMDGKPFVLNPGKWTLSVETKQRLFWDFVVLLPAEYYEGSALLSAHSKACEAGTKNGNNGACIDLLYPPLNSVPRADVTKEGVHPFMIKDQKGKEQKLEMVPIEIVSSEVGPAVFVRADNDSRVINAKIEVPDTDKYVVLLEYHNREKTDLPLDLQISQQNENKASGVATVHYCPYATFCRELVTEGGQPLVVPLESGDAALSLTVSPMHEFGLAAVNLIKEKDWSNKYLEQVPVCVRKDQVCQPLVFPPASASVAIEAELGQRESRPIRGDKLAFNIANAEEVTVVPLDSTNPNLEISGVVQMPHHYMLLVHYYNPDNTPSNVEVLVSSNDHFYEASIPFSYCPSVGGCRALIREEMRPEVIQFYLEDKYTVQLMAKDTDGQKGPILIDSLTAVPYDSFSTNLLQPLPMDLSGDFVEQCSEGFFRNHPSGNVSDFCKSHIFSLTTDFNQNAFACECNSQGSTSFTCERYGGQCECKENIMGRRCERCKSGYYGFPECKKCKCGKNQQCDERTGQCFCPPHVEGINCDKCVIYAFGYDPLIGCQKCGCHAQGSEGGQAVCDASTGQCLCREQVGGRQCDTCLAGHYGFPYCHACRCKTEGTTAQVCDVQTAQCKCRENVVGQQCEQCKAGTFALAASHEKGCIDCFCFGVTDRCQSSFFPVTIEPIDPSLVLTTDKEGNVTVDSNGYVTYVAGSSPPKVVYFEIPVQEAHDYTNSYGLFLSFSLSSSSSPDGLSPEADLVLRGANMTAEMWASEQPNDPSDPFNVRLQLSADTLLSSSGKPLTREEVMMILYSLTSIRIKASYYTSTPSAQLRDYSLERANDTSRDVVIRAATVERCACPAPYKGHSCQECADGYYRVKGGRYLGSCVPCQCNGHSGSCDKETGECLDCMHSTQGSHCESCVEGHYGDATSGSPYACSPCNCPYAPENNFATACSVTEEGLVQSCTCKQGYGGERCEKCDAGYFGDPETSGGSCERCNCNGNNDLRDPQACHFLTGHCYLCQNNTYGSQCEHCAPWFFGDAVEAKNCASCSCDQCGSHSCDSTTGLCRCKVNVVGDKCDRCAPDHYAFSRCGGCHECRCDVASSSTQCHDVTGQCPCRPGATGLHCEQCEYGFWNYGESGCTKCDCEADLSLGTVCDVRTGQCQCQEGATGPRCDKCLAEYLRIPTMGCRKCDECVHHLMADVESLSTSLDSLSSSISNISAATIDGARLARIQKKLDALNETKFMLDELQSGTENSLLFVTKQVLDDVAVVSLQFESSRKQSVNNSKKAIELADLGYKMRLNFTETTRSSLAVVDFLRSLAQAIEASAGRPKPIVEWIEEGKRIVERIEQSNANLTAMNNEVQLEKVNESLKEVKDKIKEMEEKIQKKRNREKEVRTFIDDSLQEIVKAQKATKSANDRTARMDIFKTESLLKTATEDVEKKNENEKKIASLTSSLKSATEELAELGEDLKETLKALNESVTNVEIEKTRRVKRDEQSVDTTALNAHAQQLSSSAAEIAEKLADTRDAAKGAVSAATVYDELATNLAKAREEAKKGKEVVEKEGEGVKELKKEVDEIRKSLASDMADAEKMKEEMKKDLKGDLDEMEVKRKEVARNVLGLKERFEKVSGGIESLNATIREELTNFGKKTENLKEGKKNEEIRAKVKEMEKDAEGRVNSAISGQQGIKQAKGNLKEIGEKAEKLPEEWKRLSEVFRNGTNRVDKLREQLRKLKESLAMARDQANKVSLPVHFDKGSSLDVSLPHPPSHSSVATDLSLLFRPQENGTLVYLGNIRSSALPSPSTDDYVVVQVEESRPVVRVQLGEQPLTVALNTRLNKDEWYRVHVSRVGRSVTFSLLTSDAKVTLETKTATSGGRHAVLNLPQSTSRLYVGGIPSTVQTPIQPTSFVGDITDVVLNGDRIGLWNANEGGIVNVNGAVKEGIKGNGASETEIGISDGFITYRMTFWNPRKRSVVSLSFLTYAPDGLIFYMGKEKDFMSIELSDGVVKVNVELGSGVGSVQTEMTYNNGEWHSLRMIRDERSLQLTVDTEVVTSEIPGEESELSVGDFVYLGGVPLDVQTRSTVDPLRGCLRDFKLGDDVQGLDRVHRSKGVSASCPSMSLTREVSFISSRSSAVFPNITLSSSDPRPPFDLAFRFRTRLENTHLATVVNDDEETVLSVNLDGGEVTIGGGEGERSTLQSATLNDGVWHYVSIRKDGGEVSASVDDAYFTTIASLQLEPETPFQKFSLSFGKGFEGCIRDVTFGGNLLQFAKSERREVRVTGCTMKEKEKEEEIEVEKAEEVTTTTTTPLPAEVVIPMKKEKKSVYPDVCALSSEPRNTDTLDKGLRFGMNEFSRLEYSSLPEAIEKEGIISFSIRVEAANGPVLYAANKDRSDYVGVFIVEGKMVFIFNTGSGKMELKSSIGLLDGEWRSVKVSRRGNYGQLTVDEDVVEGKGDQSTDSLDYSFPIYVGGVSNETVEDFKHIGMDKMKTELHGCIRDLSINGKSFGDPSKNEGVVSCGEHREDGLFLGPGGGYATVSYPDPIQTLSVEILFKARTSNGVIFSIGKVEYLSLSMKAGSLVFVMKTAEGIETKIVHKPQKGTAFCDGHWHHVKLFRKKNMITMSVDGKSSLKVGKKAANHDFSLKDPMVIGTPPKAMVHDDLLKNDNFVGCIKVVNDSSKDGKRKRREEEKTPTYESFEASSLFGDAHQGCSAV